LLFRSQDVRHVLTRTFGDLFTRDAIPVDTIKNLITTRGGEDEYHERHVDCLQEVFQYLTYYIHIHCRNVLK